MMFTGGTLCSAVASNLFFELIVYNHETTHFSLVINPYLIYVTLKS